MKNLLMLILVFLNVQAFACYCDAIPPLRNKEDLKGYDFIALAKVKELSAVDRSRSWNDLKNGDIRIEIIELFKGNREVVISEPDVNTSCGLGINLGEEWLFFGRKGKSKIQIGACDLTTQYRDASGLRNWNGLYAIQQLTKLQEIYSAYKPDKLFTTILYTNGKTELMQTFKNGQLNGLRTIYYPTGQVYVKEKFKDGRRKGYRKIYSPSGQLTYRVRYKNDLVKDKIFYFDTTDIKIYIRSEAMLEAGLGPFASPDDYRIKRKEDSLYRAKMTTGRYLSSKMSYTNKGRSYKYTSYNHAGRMVVNSCVDYKRQTRKYLRYRDDGTLEYYDMMDARRNTEIIHEYRINEARRDVMQTCESCKYYFDPKYDNGSKPEAIYLW